MRFRNVEQAAPDMSRRSNFRGSTRRKRRTHNRDGRYLHRRPLRLEPLEDRRLLALVTVTTDQDIVDFNDGVTSLREAIFATNTVPGADTIDFDFGHDGPATILLTQGQLKITDSLSIAGPGADLLTIDASGIDPTPHANGFDLGDGSRVFLIDDGDFDATTWIDVALSGLKLTGGDPNGGANPSWPSSSGGAIASSANLTLSEMRIVDNFAHRGGGVSSLGGTLTVVDSEITGNSASDGGGIQARGTMVSIQSSLLAANKSSGGGQYGGGAISIGDGNLTILDSTISGNDASGSGQGGGLLFNRVYGTGQLEIRRSTITGNTGARVGGGVWAGVGSGSILIEGSTIAENSANEGGGGLRLALFGGEATIRGSIIRDNTARNGGGIYSFGDSGALEIERTTISANSAVKFGLAGNVGGGILVSHSPNVTASIRASTIAGNVTQFGGGISVRSGHLFAEQTTISGNSADVAGGIFVAHNASIRLAHSTIAFNEASDAGSGIYLSEGELELDHAIVAANVGGAGGDLTAVINSPIEARYSLIGYNASDLEETLVGVSDANGNLIGGPLYGPINPLLGPLADNGGPTMTHALLPGSAAVNAGDPNVVAGENGVPTHDQRGKPFVRVFGGRIDIGAWEWQPPGFLRGDYNQDGIVNQADYTFWRNAMGMSVPPGAGADGNGDGQIDEADYYVWKSNFGATIDALPALPLRALAAIPVQTQSASTAASTALPILPPVAAAETRRGFVHRARLRPTANHAANDDVLAAWIARRGVERPDGQPHNSDGKRWSVVAADGHAASALDAVFDELGVLKN
jgi:Dockerin type I domain